MQRMRPGTSRQQIVLGNRFLMPMKSRMTREGEERDQLYQSQQWQRCRKAFLSFNRFCVECGEPATTVDHKFGHHDADWRTRFFDPRFFQAMCATCHNRKSAEEKAFWRKQGEG
jgi:hypothetical protein